MECTAILYMVILLTAFLFTACKKYEANKPQTDNTEQVTNNNGKPDLELFSHTMVLIHKHYWNFSKLKQQLPNIKT
jgi:PBP1b-binding outer membrane lipoprotein LpoB